MSIVRITINDHEYPVLCEDGQEEEVRLLAQHFAQKVKQIKATTSRSVNDAHLFLLASLLNAAHTKKIEVTAEEGLKSADALNKAGQSIEKLTHFVEQYTPNKVK